MTLWPQMLADQPADIAYRRLYYYLHKLVDQAIGRILDALDDVGDGRRHHRRVHLGPRRPARRPRRTAAEVVQRVRRGDPRPVSSSRARASQPSPGASPSRPATSTSSRHCSGLAGIDVERPRPTASPSTTPRPTRSPAAT